MLVLDEATAMLDPLGRKEVLDIARRLQPGAGVTVIAVTHFMREAIEADRIVIMDEGQIALQGPPREVFQQIDRLRELHLDVPHVSELALALHRRFPAFPPDLLTPEEVAEAVVHCCEEEQLSIVNGQRSMVNANADHRTVDRTPDEAYRLSPSPHLANLLLSPSSTSSTTTCATRRWR